MLFGVALFAVFNSIIAPREAGAQAISDIKRLETQWPNVGRVTIAVEAEVSSYFNYLYSESESTHYAFRLRQGYDSLTAYCPRRNTACRDLRNLLVSNGSTSILASIRSGQNHGDEGIWTLLSWSSSGGSGEGETYAEPTSNQMRNTQRENTSSCSNFMIVNGKKKCF